MKWAVRERLRMIDFLLDHYGELNRAAICDYFGISVPQATKDLTKYQSVAPGNMLYSTTRKKYTKSDQFKRRWE